MNSIVGIYSPAKGLPPFEIPPYFLTFIIQIFQDFSNFKTD